MTASLHASISTVLGSLIWSYLRHSAVTKFPVLSRATIPAPATPSCKFSAPSVFSFIHPKASRSSPLLNHSRWGGFLLSWNLQRFNELINQFNRPQRLVLDIAMVVAVSAPPDGPHYRDCNCRLPFAHDIRIQHVPRPCSWV